MSKNPRIRIRRGRGSAAEAQLDVLVPDEGRVTRSAPRKSFSIAPTAVTISRSTTGARACRSMRGVRAAGACADPRGDEDRRS
jgi:hypothetical protein